MDNPVALKNRRILVIEDDFFVAQALSALLVEAGASVVGPIGYADEALAFVDATPDAIDAAILDVNLHGQTSYAIADELAKRHIHFVFATGYGADALDPAYRRYPRCEKPFDASAVIQLLAAL